MDPALDTETLAEVVVDVGNDRWRGTPFILRSGEVVFKDPAKVPGGLNGQEIADRLVLELKPAEMVLSLSINAERPGPGQG